ncbi:MAG TPA: ABC transporter ATP-binding protein [Polyangiaceae bacterium]|jgi:NitT/TauT family transport system ATP-binding protein|nr:ABC transporter ATP-binding protein [Polyangiaceae bacterium]
MTMNQEGARLETHPRDALGALGAEPAVEFSSVSLTFPNGTHAVDDVSFSVRRGEFVALLGPSGSGKSTLLRLLAGFESPTSGSVRTNGASLGYVFQDATLLPWRNVLENVELPAQIAKIDPAKCRERALSAIRRVGLAGFEDHKPSQLSGGMRMRTSIARMLTMEPRIFLFDEPFGALDDMTRESLNEQVVNMFTADPFAGLFVTHSVRESVFLSTRVLVLSPRPGRVAADIEIPFPFPRSPELTYTPEFTEVTSKVARALRQVSQ